MLASNSFSFACLHLCTSQARLLLSFNSRYVSIISPATVSPPVEYPVCDEQVILLPVQQGFWRWLQYNKSFTSGFVPKLVHALSRGGRVERLAFFPPPPNHEIFWSPRLSGAQKNISSHCLKLWLTRPAVCQAAVWFIPLTQRLDVLLTQKD